jgi:hypothetical protein
MKSACRAKEPTLMTGCHCSKLVRTTWPGTMPRRYAVTYSDFIIFIQIYGANRNDDLVYCLPFPIPVLLLLCPFSVIALRNSNSKFEFKAIPVESSRPLGLMRPPRAAERRSFEGQQILLLPLVPQDGARRRLLRLAGLYLAGRLPFP